MVPKSSYNVIRVLCVPILISLSVAVWYIWRWPALWSRSNQVQVAKCDPRADSPVLISLKTKMPVFYDASQWFHMAENYLVQHSILGGENKLTDSRVVVYNFDKDNFKNSLNGFTRLMVYLGTISPGAHTEYIHFLNEPNLIADERQLQPGDGILMSSKAISHAETVFLGQDMSSHERFLRTISATLPSLRGSEQHDNPSMISLSHMDTLLNDSHEFGVDGKSAGICVRYLGSIGSQIIPRKKWFPRRSDIHSFRRKIVEACPAYDTLLHIHAKKTKFKLVLYQRDRNRRLLHPDQALTLLAQHLPGLASDWEIITITHNDQSSPCELSHMLSNVDVLLTPHGFQSMLLLFLPIPSVLLEIFPQPYRKNVYHIIASDLGIVYGKTNSLPTMLSVRLLSQVISQRTWNQNGICRYLSRLQDVTLAKNNVEELTSTIRDSLPLLQLHPEYTKHQELQYQPVVRDILYVTKQNELMDEKHLKVTPMDKHKERED